jgi:hypothetical protein
MMSVVRLCRDHHWLTTAHFPAVPAMSALCEAISLLPNNTLPIRNERKEFNGTSTQKGHIVPITYMKSKLECQNN